MTQAATAIQPEINPAPAQQAGTTIIWFWLGALIFVQLIPIWWFRYLPTQDGPAHVETSIILRDLLLRKPSIYAINPHPVPNWLGHLLMALFSTIVTGRIAEKLLVSLYVIAFPVSAALAGRWIRRGGEWIGILILPFIYSVALHKGLYNFCLSLAGWFLLIGLAMRIRPQRKHIGVAIAIVALLVYFSHVVSLIMAIVVIAALGAEKFISTHRWKQQIIVAAALLPAAALALWFFISSPGAGHDHLPLTGQLLRFFELDILASFRRPEAWVGILYSATLWGTTAAILSWKIARRNWSRWDWMLALVPLTLIIYLAAPNSAAGGGQISFRLSLYPYFVLILWLAGQPIDSILQRCAITSAATLSIALLALHWPTYSRLNTYLHEYDSVAAHIQTEKSVVSVDDSLNNITDRKLAWKIRPFWHALGYPAAQKNMVNLGNYEIQMGYFPVIRKGAKPQSNSVEIDSDVSAEERRILFIADYVVVWDLEGQGSVKDPLCRERLHSAYQVVYRSPHGWATVHRRKG